MHVFLDLKPNGRGKVVVNGKDISKYVAGVGLALSPGQSTRLRLDLVPTTLRLQIEDPELFAELTGKKSGEATPAAVQLIAAVDDDGGKKP